MSRALRVSGAAVPHRLGLPLLSPIRLEGVEAINSLFEYRLLLKTPDSRAFSPSIAADLKLNEAVGREITVHLELDSGGTPGLDTATREISGLVTQARFVRRSDRHVYYEYTLRPWLHLATLSSDCRIFHDKNVVEILDEVLSAYAFPVEKRLGTAYPPREMQTQMNETNAAFVFRLCQEWGINFHFEHSGGRHRLVLSDGSGGFRPNPGEAYRRLRFHDGRSRIDEEFVAEFSLVESLVSGAYRSRDYDYTRPRAKLESSVSDPRDTGHADQTHYLWRADHGSDYSQPNAGSLKDANQTEDQGMLLARLRMDALRQHGLRAQGRGALRGLLAGHTFELTHHPRPEADGEYLAIATALLVEDVAEASVAESDEGQQWRVDLRFEAQPARQELRPDPTQPKPRQHSPETAIVVGANDAQGVPNNIHTDHLGRVKVQFHWDRQGTHDQSSSCWVRVSSDWAGNQLGAMHLPRVGQEVIVSFIGGDPDLPLVTGRVFNQLNLPPWELPGQQALSGFRSRELQPDGGNSAAGRSNHLILDDTAGGIQAQLKSDHQHSQLVLGDIARIDDRAGRMEKRGEGFELTTEGHGALRAGKGMLISTDGRAKAIGEHLSRDEMIARLERALALAKELGRTAQSCDGGVRDTGPLDDLAQAVDALGNGTRDDPASQPSTSRDRPILAISGAAGIVSATPDGHVQSAGLNIDTIAGHSQQHYAEHSILHTAGQDIEQFAHHGDIRSIASEGGIFHQAQHGGIEITGQKRISITSTEDDIVIDAKKSLTIRIADGAYLRLAEGGVTLGMPGPFIVKSAGRQFMGASTLSADLPTFDRIEQAQQLKLHHFGEKNEYAPTRGYRIVKGSGVGTSSAAGADAISPLDGDRPFDINR
jgi:type VI secretion system secreted protein VgrG